MARMPKQKPGRSRQCYATPAEFIRAVENRFGALDFDLAATERNAKAKRFYTRRQNSLIREWKPLHYHFWLNPPYGHIMPWSAKCESVASQLTNDGAIYLLVPASVCSRWFISHVWGKATVNFISPRLCFIRGEPYPKDLMLCEYKRQKPKPENMFVFLNWQTQTLINQKGLNYEYKRAA